MTDLRVLILGNETFRVHRELFRPEGVSLEIRGDTRDDYYDGRLSTFKPYRKSPQSVALAKTANRGTDAVVIFDNRGLGLELAREVPERMRSRTLIVLPAGQVPRAGYLEIAIQHFVTTTRVRGRDSIRDFLRQVADGTIA
jgi:hypothetical protein